MFAVDNQSWQGWYSYEQLKYMITLVPEEHPDGYGWSDSPEAEYITGFGCDSYADDSCDLIKSIWKEYVDNCEDEEKTPDMEEYLDILWDNFDYQLCHTWARITNIHIESDEEIRLWDRESCKGMLQTWISEGAVRST